MLERSGLESVSVGAVDVVNTNPKLAILGDTSCGDLDGAVCGIVKDLDLEKLSRIPDLAYGAPPRTSRCKSEAALSPAA